MAIMKDDVLISNLKFISMIRSGEKVNIASMHIQPSGFLTTISRTFWNRCSRSNLMSFLSNTFDACSERLDSSIRDDIKKELSGVKKGLSNLQITYVEDVKMNCDLQVYIDQINKIVKPRLGDWDYQHPVPVAKARTLTTTPIQPPPPKTPRSPKKETGTEEVEDLKPAVLAPSKALKAVSIPPPPPPTTSSK